MQSSSKLEWFLVNETGMAFPSAVIRFIQAFVDQAQSLESGVDTFLKLIGAAGGLGKIDAYRGYESVPVEGQFPFLTGGGGEAHGWLDLCPEVKTFSKPFLTYGPAGGYMEYFGCETKDYLGKIIRQYHDHNGYTSIDLPFLHSLGIYPDQAKNEHGLFDVGRLPLTRLTIRVPIGYKNIPSYDGVGVCAPAAFFNPLEDKNYQIARPADELYELVTVNSKLGYYATVLLYLKDLEHRLYFTPNHEGVPYKDIYLQMIKTYEALNRPELASVIQDNKLSFNG